MKRGQVLFVVLVFGFLAIGFLRGRGQRSDPASLVRLTDVPRPSFEPLEPPIGDEQLSGVVVDVDGALVAGLEVLLFEGGARRAQGAAPLHWTLTDSEGRFAFDQLAPGPYGALLFQPGRRPEERSVDVPLPLELVWQLQHTPVEELERLPEMVRADLVGLVEPPPPSADDPIPSVAGYEVLLTPEAEPPLALSGAMKRRARVATDGSYRFEGLVTGPVRLTLLPRWARSGSWPVLDTIEWTHTADGASPPPLRVRSGRIAGRLTDPAGRPIEGALVQVHPEAHPERVWPAHSTDEHGTFSVSDLPPGGYVVEVHAGAAHRSAAVLVRQGRTHLIPFEPLDPRR